VSYKNKEEKKQYNKQWRQDHREQTKQYNQEHREQTKQYNKQYNQEHKEEKKQYNKQWRQDHREQTKQYNKQWSKNRYQIDIMYRLNRIIRSAIKQSLKKNSLSKNHRPWETLVGFTIQELKLHLEKQFDSNMNWNNHGTYWHLDHIIPLSSLKFSSVNDENFKFLWCLTNLQPLFGPENISKSNKFIINLYSLLFPFVKI